MALADAFEQLVAAHQILRAKEVRWMQQSFPYRQKSLRTK